MQIGQVGSLLAVFLVDVGLRGEPGPPRARPRGVLAQDDELPPCLLQRLTGVGRPHRQVQPGGQGLEGRELALGHAHPVHLPRPRDPHHLPGAAPVAPQRRECLPVARLHVVEELVRRGVPHLNGVLAPRLRPRQLPCHRGFGRGVVARGVEDQHGIVGVSRRLELRKARRQRGVATVELPVLRAFDVAQGRVPDQHPAPVGRHPVEGDVARPGREAPAEGRVGADHEPPHARVGQRLCPVPGRPWHVVEEGHAPADPDLSSGAHGQPPGRGHAGVEGAEHLLGRHERGVEVGVPCAQREPPVPHRRPQPP